MLKEPTTGFQIRNILFVLLILLAPILYSCTTSSHSLSKDDTFISSKARMTGWKKIVILPFSGEPVSRRVSAELFSYYLQEQPHFEIIGPAISEIELKKRGIAITETALSNKDILHMGEILGADAIIACSVSRNAGWRVSTVATLFEVNTGKIIAQGERVIQNWNPQGNSESEDAKKAIKFSAYEMLTVLYELAGDLREFQILKKRHTLKERPIDTFEGELY